MPILTTRIFGFLLGSTVAGAGLYYYVVDEYRVSNELLTEDVYVSSFSQMRLIMPAQRGLLLTSALPI